MIGETIDSCYEIIREIGSGAMGGVFEAKQTFTDRRVAIKLLNRPGIVHAKDVITRFEREALAAAKLSSPHIVQILDAGHDPTTGLPYTVMELLQGEGVDDLLTRVGSLAPSLTIRIVAQICRGLEKAHEAGMIHRDVK
ncbi:MAG: serine/threonine-protein kinase, partial [Polyangiaceae bacterium]